MKAAQKKAQVTYVLCWTLKIVPCRTVVDRVVDNIEGGNLWNGLQCKAEAAVGA